MTLVIKRTVLLFVYFLSSCGHSNLPETQGLSIGFPATGTVKKKFTISDTADFEVERFGTVAGDGATLVTTATLDPLSRLFFSTTELARSAATAAAGAAESDFKKQKCLYEVVVDDETIHESVRSQIFFSASSAALDSLGPTEELIGLAGGDTVPVSLATDEEIDWWKKNKPPDDVLISQDINPKEKEKVIKSKSVTIPQTCNAKIVEDTKVFISFHTWGASLHILE